MTIAFIIVAAGSGSRMGAPLPKQYLPLGGRPILTRTVCQASALLSPDDRIVLVIPPSDEERVRALLRSHCPGIAVTVVGGGATRTESVRRGIRAAGEGAVPDLVAVHDGVRPFLFPDLWERLLSAMGDVAIPVVPPVDSLRLVEPTGGSLPLERNRVRAVQTPQLFRYNLLREAYECEEGAGQTDDAGLFSDHFGRSPELVEGDPDNIKITTPRDLATAEWILTHRMTK